MPDVTTADLIGRAENLRQEALAIYADVDNNRGEGWREEIQKADEMLDEAGELVDRATKLKDIKAKAQATVVADAQEADEQDDALNDGKSNRSPEGSDFKDMAEFLRAVHHASRYPNRRDGRLVAFRGERDGGHERKDLAEADGSLGGYLVPLEQLMNVMAVAAENSIVRQRATIIPMRRRSVTMPVLDQTQTTAGQPHQFGGLLAYWDGEAVASTASDPTWREVQLVAHKLTMLTYASEELLADSAVSIAAFLASDMGFSGAVRWEEDYAFLRGSGAGQPLGVLNADATISFARQSTVEYQYEDFAGMMQRFLPTGNGVWVMNQTAMSHLITLSGPSGNPAYIFSPDATQGVPGRLLGLPVIFTEKTPVFNSAGDVLLADFSYYLVGDRQATDIRASDQVRFTQGQIAWRLTHRVDGQPWLSNPITLQDGTNQISPFVQLGAKST